MSINSECLKKAQESDAAQKPGRSDGRAYHHRPLMAIGDDLCVAGE
jgi:hypothetical protein